MRDVVDERKEDEEILRVLDELAVNALEDPQHVLDGQDDSTAEIRRSCLAALMGMTLVVEPVEPAPEVREKLLGRISDEYPVFEGSIASRVDTARAAAAARRPPPGWLLPLAAVLVVALVGVSGWQLRRVGQQEETIVRLSEEIESARAKLLELATAREMLAETQARLEMVTAASAEYCALKAPPGSPYPEARGTLVMLGDKEDWFLKVDGLEPCEQGRQYKLWFMTDREPVLGASFAVTARHESIEIRSAGAPEGIKAVMITLEQPDVEDEPSQPAILYGDERMRIL